MTLEEKLQVGGVTGGGDDKVACLMKTGGGAVTATHTYTSSSHLTVMLIGVQGSPSQQGCDAPLRQLLLEFPHETDSLLL